MNTYNRTLTYESVPEKDPSGVDTLFTRTTISIETVLSPGMYPAASPSEDPASILDRVQHLLTSPRRPLVYEVNGVNLISLPAGRDDASGPEPSGVTVTQITPGSFNVTFTVTVRLTRCGASLSRPNLSIRWTERCSVGENWLTRKERSGLLICSSRGMIAPDEQRELVTPLIEPGFRRLSSDYQLEESGLRLAFSFVDEQLAAPLPPGVLDYDGVMREVIPTAGGMRYAVYDMTVTGIPGVTSKRALLEAAIDFGMTRVYASNPLRAKKGKAPVLLTGEIAERISTKVNQLTLRLRWAINPPKARVTGTTATQDLLTEMRGSNLPGVADAAAYIDATTAAVDAQLGRLDATSPENKRMDAVPVLAPWLGLEFPGSSFAGIAPPTRGLAPWVGNAAALLNDPCGQQAVMAPTADRSIFAGRDSSGARVTATIVQQIPDDEDGQYSDTGGPGLFERYEVVCHYNDHTGLVVNPAAQPGGDAQLVRLTGELLTMRAEWSLKRVGGQPEAPKVTEVSDPNWWYIGGTCSPKNLDVAGDGVSAIYEVSGVWNFAAKSRAKAKI